MTSPWSVCLPTAALTRPLAPRAWSRRISGLAAGAGSVVIETDGKIIAAGATESSTVITPSGYLETSFALARHNSDGSLDSTFGAGGETTTDFGDHLDTANAIVLQPDGKIVAVGGTGSTMSGPLVPGSSSFAVACYLPDNVGTPNQRFVEQLYWDLLRRPVDAAGLASWSGLLDQGLARTQIATAIQNSPEYHTLVVGDLYLLVLGRTADASGLTTWVNFLNQGHTAEQLETILLGSEEFFVTHGSANNQGFLPALYQIVLQRPIDPSGAQSWGQALQSDVSSRQDVAAGVLANAEADGLEVQSLYTQFLHRVADPSGLDTSPAFSNTA